MNLAIFTAAFLLLATDFSLATEKCDLDLVFSVDHSTTLTPEQFERTKSLIVETYKTFSKPEHSTKLGLVSFGETAQSLVTLLQGEESQIIEREIGSMVQKGGRPSLMKALQMMQTFFKAGNGERETARNVAVIFIAGEPSNIIGSLKQANILRQAGVKVITAALIPREEGSQDRKTEFVEFLGTISGGSDNVFVLNPASPKYLDQVSNIAGAICPAAFKTVVDQSKKPAGAVDVVEQIHRGPVSDYKPAAAELLDQLVADQVAPLSRVVRTTTSTRPPPTPSTKSTTTKATTKINSPPKTTPPPLPPKTTTQLKPSSSVVETQMDLPIMPLHIVPRRHKTTTTTTTQPTTTLSPKDLQALEFCQNILNDTDVMADQFFGNPDDCTSFYQCSLETGVLTAKSFSCQPGMFWKEQLKQCMPGVACKDRCEEPAIARRGVWADPNNCRRWFQCANSISYPACCPSGTAYDDVLTTCVTTENCHDECDTGAPANSEENEGPTTVEPRYDANGCHDRWGGLKRPNRRNPTKYFVHIGKNNFVPVNCPLGTRFDLMECDCINGDGEDENFMADLPPLEIEPEEIHATMYFPFDENLNDYSKHRLWVTPVVFGGAWVDQRIRVHGEGSARISSSGIACPGLSGADFRDHLTVGMWIKCYSASSLCYGDLFANGNAKAAPTIRISLREIAGKNTEKPTIATELSLQVASVDEPVSLVYPLPRPAALASWTHIGLRYDGYALSLFLNGTLITEVAATGNIGVSMTQIVVAGSVVIPHQFRGYVDEVLVLPVALDDAGMKSLLKADMARLAHDGWIKV